MATKTINAELLTKMFLAGAANLEAKKEFINELNVFPVPDGDTGTNMTLTIMSAAKEVSALSEPDDRRGKICSGENTGYASGLKRSRRCGFRRTGTVGSDERRVRCISRKRNRLQRDRSKFRNDDGKTGGAGTGGY